MAMNYSCDKCGKSYDYEKHGDMEPGGHGGFWLESKFFKEIHIIFSGKLDICRDCRLLLSNKVRDIINEFSKGIK